MAVGANVDVKIDVNQTVDQIKGLVTYDKKYVVMIANKTNYRLSRVGAYNDSENWPIGDIEPDHLAVQQFDCNSFSFASNYQISEGKGFIQLSASWPLIGRRKIAAGTINESGNNPAHKVWDQMDDPSDKFCSNAAVNVRAFLQEQGKSILWFYEITQK